MIAFAGLILTVQSDMFAMKRWWFNVHHTKGRMAEDLRVHYVDKHKHSDH